MNILAGVNDRPLILKQNLFLFRIRKLKGCLRADKVFCYGIELKVAVEVPKKLNLRKEIKFSGGLIELFLSYLIDVLAFLKRLLLC